MKFYNVRIAAATITLMAANKADAVSKAAAVYRQHNNLPTTFDVTGLYRGCDERKFQPGDTIPAGA